MKIIIQKIIDYFGLEDYDNLTMNLGNNNYYLIILILSIIFLFYCGLPFLFEIIWDFGNPKKNKNF